LLLGAKNDARNVAVATINLTMNKKNRRYEKDISGELINMNEYNADQSFMTKFTPSFHEAQQWADFKVTELGGRLVASQSLFGDAAFTDIIHQLQLSLTDADISFTSPQAFNLTIEPGRLTVKDMFKFYRYENQLYTITLTGKVFLKDHTLEQAQELLQSIVDDYLKGTTVIVRLAIFKVTMLGEFNRPGEYSVYESKFNIFDAIAQAGDLTTFAKRNKIYLVRQTESGSKVVHLDLNDIGILESEYYTIMPNDIIYAQPVKGKNFAFREFPYSLIFTTISTTLLLINFFKTN
jgi:2',3'-cyclic-nucleotide 2'-phosphodiesterase (5'-nucleotidase family)